MSVLPTETTNEATFDALSLPAEVRSAVDDLGYVHPTPVQLAVFEPASEGRDLVVQARTGTGKTAAFGLPLVSQLVRRNVHATQALVLCPTRELALQVCEEVTALSKYREVSVVAVYGGAGMQRQIEQLESGAQVLVGTPGRVLDHLRRGTLSPDQLRIVVLDESDEMLSMGFLPQINEILAFIPTGHQTLLFSATLPPGVRRMAETRLREPVFLTLSGDQIGALEVEHHAFWSIRDKVEDFVTMLELENPESAIVFCNTREQTKRVAGALRSRGYAADWLNADLAQPEREKVMAATRAGEVRFLVATDVAARGIDISHLTHVLNFDFPSSAEAYVHRTGRTGRAGRTGTAISMVTPDDVGGLYMLRLTYGIRPVQRSVPSARELKTRAETDLIDSLARYFTVYPVSDEDRSLAQRLLSHDHATAMVAGLLRGHLGDGVEPAATAAAERRARHPQPKIETNEESHSRPRRRRDERPREDLEDVDAEVIEGREEEGREEEQGREEEGRDTNTAEVFVNVGRRDGARPEHFHALLEAGGLGEQTEYVHVRQRHAFVGVPKGLVERAIAAIDGATISGKQAVAEEARRPGT